MGKRQSASWMYMSRLASIKEHAFMKALYDAGFPVPRPVDQNRHCVLMTIAKGFPLYQLNQCDDPSDVSHSYSVVYNEDELILILILILTECYFLVI